MSEFEEEAKDALLLLDGMTDDLAKIFREFGFFTVESIAIESPRILYERIGERKGFTEDTARKIVKSALSTLKVRVMTVQEALEEEKAKQVISTGSKKLDELLGGGVHTMELTEAIGDYGVGKTELCYQIAINAARDYKWGSLLYDTEATFSSRRVQQMAEAIGLNPEEILPQISYTKIYGTEHLIFMLQNAHKIIRERNIRFLAIDSLTSPFRAEYIGRELLAPRQQLLNRCIRMLLNYARIYKMAVLATNQVLATPIAFDYARPETQNPPSGGHIMAYGMNNRVYIRRGTGSVRIARLIDSSYLPPGEVVFTVSEKGIEDVLEEAKK